MERAYVTLPAPDAPPEQVGGVIFGTIGHLGSPVSYVILLAIFGVTLPTTIGLFLGVSVVFLAFTLWAEHRHASLALTPATGREIWDGLAMVFVKGVGVGGGLVTFGWWVLSHVPLYGALSNNWWLIAAATLGTDLGYYWIHRLLSHSRGTHRVMRYYRKKHNAHHSVTALDFLRGNQSSLVDTAISQFQPTLILVSWLLGMDLAPTLAAYALILMLQATDHSSVTFNIGWLKYVFMDNHAHKLHHCRRGNLVNHAAAFSFFDRLWGTYYEDWSLSANYLHENKIPLPIKEASRRPVAAAAEVG